VRGGKTRSGEAIMWGSRSEVGGRFPLLLLVIEMPNAHI